MKLTFKILQNGEAIQTISWEPGVYRIGRSEFCDLVLPSESISRSQLEVRITEAAAYVTNMATAGKLKINHEILETSEINEGDVLSIGPYELLSQFGEPMEEPGDAGPAAEPEYGESPVVSPAEFNEPAAVISISRAFAREPALQTEGTSALRSETLVEAKPLVAKLVFTTGPKRGTELFLDAYEVTLGRSKKADICIEDDKLSRLHAKITRVGIGFRLIDLSSRHGTFVNGIRVLEHPLVSFDVIEIGNSKIQFFVHDMASAAAQKGVLGPIVPMADTKSLQLIVNPDESNPPIGFASRTPDLSPPGARASVTQTPKVPRRPVLVAAIAILALVSLWWLMTPPTSKPITEENSAQTKPEENKQLPPTIPREFTELSPENQRAVEGYYNSALGAAEKSNWEEALWNLGKLRELVPFYKQSIELAESYNRRLKERQLEESQKKAATTEKADLQRYLQEGVEYLKEGNFDLAADAFNQAITIDPVNELARKGLRAAEYKVKDIALLPSERDLERERKKQVADLFQAALTALQNKSYQEAIIAGEKIRGIELKGDTKYLNEAKVIIDRAKLLQKEEFEPFLVQAKEKFAEGDYSASRDLCEEMLKRDPAYDDAKECTLKARKQLGRLAKENYTTGYVLESMNRIEEAKQYWNRAKNFVRPGDPYYEKVMKKLDDYQ